MTSPVPTTAPAAEPPPRQSHAWSQRLLFVIVLVVLGTGLWLLNADPFVSLTGAGVFIERGQREEPPLLLSELTAAREPASLIDTGFTLVNNSGEDVTIRYDGAGCSCYDVLRDGTPLRSGDEFLLPAGTRDRIQMAVSMPKVAGSEAYRADFTARLPSGEVIALPIHLGLNVYPDLEIRPVRTVLEVVPGEELAPMELSVTRRTRDRGSLDELPKVPRLPDELRLDPWSATPVQEPGPQLWSRTWSTRVHFQLTPGEQPSDRTLDFEIVATEQPAPLRDVVSLLVRPKIGLRGPQELALGTVPVGESRTRRLLILSADGTPFRITGVESDNPQWTMQAESNEAAVRHWLTAQVTAVSAGLSETGFTLTTDHPDALQYRIAGRVLVLPERD